jgi:hypothetical protein
MFEQATKRNSSSVISGVGSSDLTLGTDLNRDPVYLDGQVITSRAFASAMLVLGKVVKVQRPTPKDHTDYQNWVTEEYMRIFLERTPDRLEELENLRTRKQELSVRKDELISELSALEQIVTSKKKAYFDWLYQNDREAWIVLDPIVSVQRDGTFFEAFSGDESIYARVFLPHENVSQLNAPVLGTTNIDFSLLLEREFERVRSYRPINLKVGLKSVDFQTNAAEVAEEKIPLPDSWVRGLVEVQSVLALAPIRFELEAETLSEIVARLDSEREKHGPRSLKFKLEPGQPIQVEIEPWGEVFSDPRFAFQGTTSQEIRVWGRRRLSVLRDILVGAESVSVNLLGSGMPSFWTIVKEGVELSVGLSGWTSNDWAAKAKFSSFLPVAGLSEQKISSAVEWLEQAGVTTAAQFAEGCSLKLAEASMLLQKLCLRGKAMYDSERNAYRWRDLFPTLDLYEEGVASLETRAGIDLAQQMAVKLTGDEVKSGVRYLSGVIKVENRKFSSLLELDEDNRPKYANCNCAFFGYNKLRQGPCRHMVALSLIGNQS